MLQRLKSKQVCFKGPIERFAEGSFPSTLNTKGNGRFVKGSFPSTLIRIGIL